MDRLPEWLKKYVGAAEHAHWADCSSRDTYDWMYNAILAFLNAAEKDGWGMVPREPTPAMIRAGHHQIDWCRNDQNTSEPEHESQYDFHLGIKAGTSCGEDIVDAYHAMLAAAKE